MPDDIRTSLRQGFFYCLSGQGLLLQDIRGLRGAVGEDSGQGSGEGYEQDDESYHQELSLRD